MDIFKDPRGTKRQVNEILTNLNNSNVHLQSGDIMVSGGTGFIGRWLVRGLVDMKLIHVLPNRIILVVTDKQTAKHKLGNYGSDIDFVTPQELEDSSFASVFSNIGYFIHGAMPRKSRPQIDERDYQEIIQLTQNLLHTAKLSTKTPSFVHLSSGAVYGNEIRNRNIIEEDCEISSSRDNDGYTRLKIEIENLIQEGTIKGDIRGSNPRLFTLYGEGLPLDEGYAIGNFIRDAIQKSFITVNGNPLTTRSYLFVTDLIEWIIKLMITPSTSNLHFGSSSSITMSELAEIIARQFGIDKIYYKGQDIEVNHYVPSNTNTIKELDLIERTSLQLGLADWASSIEMRLNL